MKKSLVRDVINSMKPAFSFSSRSEERGMVNLRDNENPFGGQQNRYPANVYPTLASRYLNALAEIEDYQGNQEWHSDWVLMTRGASDGLDLIFRTFFEPRQDSVIVTPPNFRLFDELATAYSVHVEPIPLLGDEFNHLDLVRIKASQAKGILLCDPNNPIGSSLVMAEVIHLLENFSGLVVIDEAYVEYASRRSFRHLIHDYPQLIVVRSLSKAMALAGLRLGAVLAQPELIQAMMKVRLPFALPQPVIEQAQAVLSNIGQLKQQILLFIQERERVALRLKNIPEIENVFAHAGFITIKAPESMATRLLNAGFDVLPNPMGLIGYIRISLAAPEVMDNLLRVLE
ncbi:aminotransferase class I/II-fold pyridoxal phosphate-dependent enzyme [Dickeya zeae]|uniref:aminotransferase class I/II-fold pyridoxal phosphate-dependent enzyme n=1 Tax=Dickeya zeae TaxID=204042 RepID=UPI0003A36CEA|nr:aminotransferase class I/II-fold pyridoxal phosphate-dependent enzyme [Dickeya zeae]